MAGPGFINIPTNSTADTSMGNNSGSGTSDILNLLGGALGASSPLGYIGPAVNVLTGLLDKGNVRDAPQVDDSSVDMMPTEFNIAPQLEQNQSDFISAGELINNNTVGPQSSAAVNNLFANKLRANSTLYGQKFNMENKMQADKAMMQGRFDMLQNRNNMSQYGMQVRADDNVGPSGNFVRAGLDDLSSVAQFNLAQDNRKATDLATAGIMMKSISGDSGIDDRLYDSLLDIIGTL